MAASTHLGGRGLDDLVWFVLASHQIRPDGEIELDGKRDCDWMCHLIAGQHAMDFWMFPLNGGEG